MKYLLLFMPLLFSALLKAQYISPLSSISKESKAHLLKFGENTSTDLLAEKTLRLFREANDESQKYTKTGFYKIPNMNSDSANLNVLSIPIYVINSLNKKKNLLSIY